MTAAAFKATFADVKFIRGRKVCQLVFELPIEGADAALAALGGVPRPDAEVWAGIARLDTSKATSDAPKPDKKPSRSWGELHPSQQAAIRCGEKAFQRFLAERENDLVEDASEAADVVRVICGVNSRADIGFAPNSGLRWHNLDNEYRAWSLV